MVLFSGSASDLLNRKTLICATAFGYTLSIYLSSFATDFTVQVTSIGKPLTLGVSRVRNGRFEVYCKENCEFYWTVMGKRCAVVVEPKKSETVINGDGPYRWVN
jgi:hypothetical protein